MEKLQLKRIYIYPVKSLSGISLKESFAGERGLENDRRWMLIDKENMFITQRQFRELALTDLKIDDDSIIINYRVSSFGEVKIPLKIDKGLTVPSKVWADIVDMLWPKLPADEWFSELLKTDIRLVYMPDTSPRRVDSKYVSESMNTSMSDGYPYLLTNQSSVDDVSERAGVKIETQRFRPNLIIETELPYEEDHFKKLTLEDVAFKIVKPCARCVITTIDPQTGITDKEPLQTLNTYRKFGNKVLFGQNMIAVNHGIIRVGDEIKAEQ